MSAPITNLVKTAALRGINTGVLTGKEEPVSDSLKMHRQTAAFLAVILGFIGVHKYYLGQRGQGIIFTLATICTFGFGALVTAPIGFIDAIRLFTMSDETFVEKYAKNWCPMTYGD
jgi:TM2 domain-containing membrane protein YozV